MTGELEFWLGKNGPRKVVCFFGGRGQLGKEHPLLLGRKSVPGTLSGHPEPSSLGEGATEGLHSQESGWPGTSSLAVQTALPETSAARPANARKRGLSSHICRKQPIIMEEQPKGQRPSRMQS